MNLSDLLDEEDVQKVITKGKKDEASVETIKKGEKLGLLVDPKFFRGAISGFALAMLMLFLYHKYVKGVESYQESVNRLRGQYNPGFYRPMDMSRSPNTSRLPEIPSSIRERSDSSPNRTLDEVLSEIKSKNSRRLEL